MSEIETPKPSAGEAVKAAQMGAPLPIGSVETILKNAPSDIVEETVEIPEWECSVRLRSFTAAQSARVKQHGLGFKGDRTEVAWAEMEIMQFMEGCIEPQWEHRQVVQLHGTSGRGFQRVIDWLDEKSGTDKEAIRRARDDFPIGEEREQD